MTEIRCTADIDGTAEQIFDIIVDLPGYHRWLSRSSAYGGTTEISSDPVAVGTTYFESGRGGVRNGRITELERPAKVTFHQPMTLRTPPLGTIDIQVRYALTPNGASTHLDRHVTLTLNWLLRLLQPVLLPQFRKESERTVAALKAFVESTAG
jgi:hypothetical protein